jgi:hypothetical protein
MPMAAEVNAMSHVSIYRLALAVAFLGLLAACGGNSKPAPAPGTPSAVGFDYEDPSGSDWRLVRDSSSSATRIVLNLVGPAGKKGRGVAFNLRSDGTVKFARFANGSYINDLGVFQLTNKHGAFSVVDGKPVTNDVGAIVGGVKEGGRVLSVGAFQKDRSWPAQALDQPLYQIAIAFDPAQALPSGAVIPLVFLKARSIPENIGDNPEDPSGNPVTWATRYRIDDVKVAVGRLVAL